MGRTIIKPSRDEDFYVEWSSIVEGPISCGTREEMREYLKESNAEERLNRAEDTGTSALWPSRSNPAYSFDEVDGRLIFEQRGLIHRHDLKVLCERLSENENADLSDLLEPFDG